MIAIHFTHLEETGRLKNKTVNRFLIKFITEVEKGLKAYKSGKINYWTESVNSL